MDIETQQKDTVIMPEKKTHRIAWRKPQLTEVSIEDVTDTNGNGAVDIFSTGSR